jgi:hypothetical protein
MKDRRKKPVLAKASAKGGKKREHHEISLRLAWGLFLGIGLPLGVMAALGPLAYAGIYVEPLRQFWRPWPPDLLKSFLGVAGFAATLGYLAHRLGRSVGFQRGKLVATVAARNVAEGRIPAPEPEKPPVVSLALVNPPLPPPPM